MSINKDANKEFISTTKKLFEEKGYDVKTSHLYDIFAKLSGYKDWHQASVKDLKLANAIKKYINNEQKNSVDKNYLDFVRESFGTLNSPQKFTLFNDNNPSWNHSVSGCTGSGKTVLVSKILAASIKQSSLEGKRILINILEMGTTDRSYQKIVSLANGNFLALSRKTKPNIQIFELVPESSYPTKEKIKDTAIKLMNKNSSLKDLNEVERGINSYYTIIANYSPSQHNVAFYKKHFEENLGVKYMTEYKTFLDLKPGEMLPSDRKKNVILSLFDIFLSSNEDKNDGFKNYDVDEINEIIINTYEVVGKKHKRFPTMTDIVENAKTIIKDNKDSSQLIEKLTNWTRIGNFPMFDLPTDLDISSDVNMINIAGLENEKPLQTIYGIVLSYLLYEKLEKNDNCRKIYIVEDFCDFLKNEYYRKFLIDSLRIARGNQIATILISQLLEDYFQHDYDTGRVIVSQFDVNIIGKMMNRESSRWLSSFLRLSSESINQLEKVGMNSNVASDGEVISIYTSFVIHNKNLAETISETILLKNILNPFEKILYSSRSLDNAIIDYYLSDKNKFNNLLDVLLYLSENNHLDDTKLIKHLKQSGYY